MPCGKVKNAHREPLPLPRVEYFAWGRMGAGLNGIRCIQCPGSYINSQLPTHPATHGTKECGWLGSCMGHPSPQSCNYPSSLCLSAPRAGGRLCLGPHLGHQAQAGLCGRAPPILSHPHPPSPRICPSSYPLNWWCHLTISSSVALFFCFQIFPVIVPTWYYLMFKLKLQH